jgi:succinate dehydrogenase/fumarate reductase-like Fe-S protein
MSDLDEFAAEMERGNPYIPLSQEAVPDALVRAARELLAATDAHDTCIAFGEAYDVEAERCGTAWQAFRAALALPRITIEEAEARGAAKERERLAGLARVAVNPMRPLQGRQIAEWILAQGGDNAG